MNFTKGKVVFVGDTGVGKTSIIYKYMRNEKLVVPTIAGNSTPIDVHLNNGNTVKLNVWDTSGSDNYQCLVPMYARTSQVAIIAFDITNEETFEHVENWLKYLNTNSNTPNIFLVGNKLDCESPFPNYSAKAEEYAQNHKMNFLSIFRQLKQNIVQVFSCLLDQLL